MAALVTVSFSLARTTGGLKVIGEVTAKASATISSTSIDQNSPQRRLSNDLADALNKLSGVSVSTSERRQRRDADHLARRPRRRRRPRSRSTASRSTRPAPPATLGASRPTSSPARPCTWVPTLGGLGGSVNFSTLQPTLSWITQIAASTGSNGRYNYSLAETGSDRQARHRGADRRSRAIRA